MRDFELFLIDDLQLLLDMTQQIEARILDSFEKKLAFLAKNDQEECPICLQQFQEDAPQAPETLGCCHKVCKECLGSISSFGTFRRDMME